MPVFDFAGPDGKTHSIEGPPGSTPEQALQMLQQQLAPPQGGVMQAIKNVPADMANTAVSMAQSAGDVFDPSSKANADYMDRMKNASFLGGIGQSAQRVIDFGKAGLSAASIIPATAMAPITSVGGAMYDAASPKFTPDQTAKLAQSGIELPSGRDVVSTALMGMRPAGASPAGPVTKPAPTPPAADLKAAGKAVYRDPAILNMPIPPEQLSAKVAQATNELVDQGFRPTPESAPSTFRELGGLTPPEPKPVDFMTRLEAEMNRQPVPTATQPVQNVNVADLRAARRALQKTAGQTDLKGTPTSDAAAASQVIGHIDDILSGVAPELKTANANYAAGSAADTVDFRNIKADRRAAKTGSGSNIENTMRQEADKIPPRGLTADEQALRDKIVLGDTTRNALRKIGKLGFGDGLSTMYHAALALPTGGTNLPVGAAATVARKIGEGLTRGQLNQLSEMIRSRSPLAQSLPPTPISPPNPLLGSLPAVQLPQAQALLLRQILGLMPSAANQQQQ